MAGEFGGALGVISVLVAVYFWRRRREVEAVNLNVSPMARHPLQTTFEGLEG